MTQAPHSSALTDPMRLKGTHMEGFDLISTGVWSIIPPILALALALITKEVYSSLAIGVFTGMVIYQFSLNGAGFEQLVDSFTMVPQMMAEQIAGNGALLLFLALLGALVVVIAGAGGSRAYGEWVATHIKNAKMAQILTAVLGIIIFVDDYFNCLTVGAVMRPVTDRFNISHEKLAWIIDSTAAPICIIAPVSSWAVAVGGYLGEGGFTTFVQSIPYNFYALLTIVFVFFMCATKFEFGPMKAAEMKSHGIEDARRAGGSRHAAEDCHHGHERRGGAQAEQAPGTGDVQQIQRQDESQHGVTQQGDDLSNHHQGEVPVKQLFPHLNSSSRSLLPAGPDPAATDRRPGPGAGADQFVSYAPPFHTFGWYVFM